MNGRIVNRRRLNSETGEWEDSSLYFIDCVQVTVEEFAVAFPDKAGVPGGQCTTGWPMNGVALAVHEKQVGEARARAKRHGISVDYKPDGTVVIPDQANYRKLCRLEGVRNKADYN